ncbi:DUF3515 domain-containing protein [Streptomyces sp. cg40]|uniref:DUF3515 domain-containing protein n=1 Tax=Streptomyces sp. cg40 TaxID=3419764 RepID=UPI003D00B204
MARPSRRTWFVLGVTGVAAVATAAVLVVHESDAPAYAIEQAPHAHAAACTRIAKDYPAVLEGHRRAETGTPGVAVWGDEAVVLRCGLEPPAPTTDLCVSVNGVDWVYRQSQSRNGLKVVVTYGRTPAVEVTLSEQDTALDSALVDVSRIVRPIRQQSHCVDSSGN